MLAASMMLVSCVDTIILPDDKTVDEDFWKTKSDVSAFVNAAYASMASNDAVARFIVWGDFRSDELVRSTTPTGTIPDALEEIAAVNMQTTNTFASWSCIYSVINQCNIVLERAPEVMELDPNYTMGDYQVDRSQVLALRALCYFYLVRNYRDVPYTTEAFMNSSQDMQMPQSAPAVVLDKCIADLEEAAKNALSARSYSVSEWRRVGWITDDAINAILADIYLWRASINHSAADYQRCIDYCDLVIESKKSQHVRGRNEVEEKEYPLADAADLYSDLYYSQNAEESIFELQSRNNLSICEYFYKYRNASSNSGEGWVKASNIFGSSATSSLQVGSNQVFANNDLRYYAACYISSESEESYHIRKMISENSVNSKTKVANRESYTYGGFNRNYIIYRLTDIMLMKAEALVQLVGDVADTMSDEEKAAVNAQNAPIMEQAFHLVQVVNSRAIYRENLADSLKWNSFKGYNKNQMEQLVLQERLRELCFEGKRWYDLMRYNYRHMTAADYNRTMYEITSEGGRFSPVYSDMLELMVRSRGADASGVSAKMQNETYLYFPVPNADIIVCPLLHQNPAYKDASQYEKSY